MTEVPKNVIVYQSELKSVKKRFCILLLLNASVHITRLASAVLGTSYDSATMRVSPSLHTPFTKLTG